MNFNKHTKLIKVFIIEIFILLLLVVKNPPANAGTQETWVQSVGWEDRLEKEMATHSSTLAWIYVYERRRCRPLEAAGV